MKALRNLSGFDGKFDDNVHKQSETVQFFITSAKHHRPRTRSSTTIWNLPDSIIVTILRGVNVKDLLSIRLVHSYFRDIVDNNKSLWKFLSFFDCWPEESNLHHFVKASECGNVEATIKLAVAYLYKEGLTKDDVYKIASEAAKYLSLAESLTPDTFPFFWIFIRPPWAPDGSCCKVQAFNHIKALVDKNKDKDLAFGIALTIKLQRLSVQGVSKNEEQTYFELAVGQKSSAATFFTLLDFIPTEMDTGQKYERVRLLRQLASDNILEAKINLVRSYIQGYYGGVTYPMAKDYAQHFFKSSSPSGIHSTYSRGPTSDISRYILVDWLVEVVGMKDFSAHTLYLAVSLFDRFLKMRSVQRSKVQLLGVAAMVISSRFLGFDILTIREAAWLTDNSYTYHDVVRMMGEIVATLKGNIRVVTVQDFVKTLLVVTGEVGYMAMLVEYIAMLCLLQSEMGQYSPAEIAASCVLLSRLLLDKDDPWPDSLKEWTGFSQDYLSLCTFHIHKKCLLEGAEVDYRDTKLKAVKQRYADSNRCSVSNIEVIGHRELCRRLGVTRLVTHGKNTKAIRFRNTDELIVSPRRGKKHPQFLRSLCQYLGDGGIADRNNAATPPIKPSSVFDDSISGYDGDLEEDSDEFNSDKSDMLYELTGDSDFDHSTTFDHFDESHDWDSEVSIIEDEHSEDLGDTDDSSFCDKTGSECGIGKAEIVCLSSMCQSGNNVNCQASTNSPSCCISNCSCQQSFSVVGLNLNRLSGAPSHSRQQFCGNYSFSSPSSASSPLSSSWSISPSSSKCLSLFQKSTIPTSSSLCASGKQLENEADSGVFVTYGDIFQKTGRKSHPSSLSSSSASTSTCDTQPIKICDDNVCHAQSFLSNGARSLPQIAQNCSCSIRDGMIPNTKFTKLGTLEIDDNIIAQTNNYSLQTANASEKATSNMSSFVEICSSNQLNSNTIDNNSRFELNDSRLGDTVKNCSSKQHCEQTNNLSLNSEGASTAQLDNNSSILNYSLNHVTCCSNPDCLHEITSTPTSSLGENVPKHFTRSSSIRFSSHSESENKLTATSDPSPENASNLFMLHKRAKLDPSSSLLHYKVSSRKCSNSFIDLLGQSTSYQNDGSGQYFTLPSRLKRKKANC